MLNVHHQILGEIQFHIFSSGAGRGLQLHLIKTPAICFYCLLPMAYT